MLFGYGLRRGVAGWGPGGGGFSGRRPGRCPPMGVAAEVLEVFRPRCRSEGAVFDAWARTAERRRSEMSKARAIVSFPSGRRGKWVVLILWIIILAVAGSLAGKLTGAERHDAQSWLAAQAQSA